MTLLDQIYLAQRNAGESVVMSHLQNQGLIPAAESNGSPSPQATIARLQGEKKVLQELLTQALGVLETINPDGDSAEGLETLMDQIEAALKVTP